MSIKSLLIRDHGGIEAITNLGEATSASSPVTKSQHDLKADLISPTLVTPNLGTPTVLVGTNITGTAAGLTAGSVTTNANLTGEVTSVGNAATIVNSAVIAKVLTGFTSGAGTVAATDTILAAVEKLDGNVAAKEDSANKGVSGGYASLDGGGKVPVAQLPSSVMTYEGVWNATTNTPTLVDGTGDAGMVYRVGTAGSQDLGSGSISFSVGDYSIYNGTTWEKSDTTDAVASVNGNTGVVVLTAADIGSTATGDVAATTVQAAIAELASEKAPLSGTLDQFAATTSAELASVISDETGTGALVFATSPTLVTPALGTPTALVGTNITGTASGLTAGNVTTNANLTGEVTSVGNAATVTNAAVIGKVLTGFSSGAGTVAATDTVLESIQKLDGNIGAVTSALKYQVTFGDGVATTYVITHSLGSADIIPFVRKVSNGQQVECEVTAISSTQVTLNFTVAPASNEYRLVVLA